MLGLFFCAIDKFKKVPYNDIVIMKRRDDLEKEPQYELVEISKLIPYVNNARTHSEEQIVQIASSIKEFGFLNPIIVSEDNTILCGHGRYEGAKKLNLKKVPCIRESHLSEAQKKAYIIADNKLAENAGWDTELLNIELAELDNLDFDLEILGFDDIEISDIFDIENEKTEKEDDFDLTAALEEATFVKRGDVWTVGRHRLMCGDATSADDVAKLMDGKKANLVITDPPYNVAFECTDGLTIKNDKMEDNAFYEFLLASFKNMADSLDKGGSSLCVPRRYRRP